MSSFTRNSYKRFPDLALLPLYIFLIFGLFFCVNPPYLAADTNIIGKSGHSKGDNGLNVSWRVEEGLPDKTSIGEVSQWLVVEASLEGQPTQTIRLAGVYKHMPEGFVPPLAVEDYNFDGYDDLYLYDGINYRGAYGEIYLFNPKTKRFEANENFSKISVRSVDKERKIVICHKANSASDSADEHYTIKDFDKPELVFAEGSESNMDNEELPPTKFRRVYKNGKLVYREEMLLWPEVKAGDMEDIMDKWDADQ